MSSLCGMKGEIIEFHLGTFFPHGHMDFIIYHVPLLKALE